jgi:hypothetical protein
MLSTNEASEKYGFIKFFGKHVEKGLFLDTQDG